MQNRGFLFPMVDFAPSPPPSPVLLTKLMPVLIICPRKMNSCVSILRFMWLVCIFKCFSHDVVLADYAVRMNTMEITISGT